MTEDSGAAHNKKPRVRSVYDTAVALGCDPRVIIDLIKSGKLVAFLMNVDSGEQLVIPQESIDALPAADRPIMRRRA